MFQICCFDFAFMETKIKFSFSMDLCRLCGLNCLNMTFSLENHQDKGTRYATTRTTIKGYKFWRRAGLPRCCHEGRFTFIRALNFASTCSGYPFVYMGCFCVFVCQMCEIRISCPDCDASS